MIDYIQVGRKCIGFRTDSRCIDGNIRCKAAIGPQTHYLVTENELTYILIDQGELPGESGVDAAEAGEVQSGSYLREDDIVCVEDPHGQHEVKRD